MSTETCLKCGHVNHAVVGSDTEACPNCGAIYARVRAAMANGQPVRATKTIDPVAQGGETASHRRRSSGVAASSGGPYIDRLRAHTQYPTFRTVVRFGLYFGYFLTAMALLGGVIAAFQRDGSAMHLLIGIGLAAVVFLLTRLWFELTIMIVDIADASVRTAENSERSEQG